MASPRRDPAAARRDVAWVSAVLAAAAIVGFIVAPRLYVAWVFLLAFSLATVPRWLLTRWRRRR